LVFFINIFLCRCIYHHHQQIVSPKKNDDIGRNTIPNEDPTTAGEGRKVAVHIVAVYSV